MNNAEYAHNRKRAKIILEAGRALGGFSFGTAGTVFGEVVFNTSLAGYQEILTDPFYKAQIVTMTYPLIGNCKVIQAAVNGMESVKKVIF